MTVERLIERLSRYPKDLEVLVIDDKHDCVGEINDVCVSYAPNTDCLDSIALYTVYFD